MTGFDGGCGWCGRPCGTPLPLARGGGGPAVEVVPERICDVCAGLLGFTVYDPVRDGPHTRGYAWEAVALLTGAEPGEPRRARRRCSWCRRAGCAGWCPTCRVLLEGAAHAAGRLLFTAAPVGALGAAAADVVAACRLEPAGQRQ